jgi:O-methyltransferase
VDPSLEHIVFCRRQLVSQGLDFQVGSAARLPAEEASFALVTSVEASHCYPNVDAFLQEVRRVLVPGGLLLLTDCRPAGPPSRLLEAQVCGSGLRLLAAHDITARVSEACARDAERFPRVFGSPKGAFPADLARVKRDEYASGLANYRSFVAENP